MGKCLDSPVKAFPGYVVIPERLTMPQVILWENSVRLQKELAVEIQAANPGDFRWSSLDNLVVPVLCDIVEEWHVTGLFKGDVVGSEHFLGTPRKASHDFIFWLGGEIRKVYDGEIEIKNG